MRAALHVFVLGAVALVAGCSSETAKRSGSAAEAPAAATNGSAPAAASATTASTPAAPAVAACTGVAAPTAVSNASNAVDLQLAGTGVFFKAGTSVNRVLKTGENKAAIFTLDGLVHSFVDASTMLIVEQDDPTDPTATLRGFAANVPLDDDGNPTGVVPAFPDFPVDDTAGDDPGGTTSATNFVAASTTVFGGDAANLYLQTLTTDGGSAEIVQIDRSDLTQTVLLTTDKSVTSPQIANGSIWYVLANQRVFTIALPTADQPAGEPTELFGENDASCNLAVTAQNAFCSIGTEIDSRDLTGSTLATLFTAKQSKVSAALFGPAVADGATLFVRDNVPDPDVKNVIRVIATGIAPTESFAACNRGTVTGIAVNADTIAWTEDGVGVFTTKR